MRRTNNNDRFSGLESLEQRRLLSADVVGDVLRIEGTSADDVIVIEAGELAGGVVLRGVEGVEDGTEFSGVMGVDVLLGEGDDSATVIGALRDAAGGIMPVRIAGGVGDDLIVGGDSLGTLIGGDGDDEISGGAHDDEIRGGAGDDTLSGGEGDDLIVGGKNADTIRGEDGGDELVGGLGFDRVIGGGGGDDINAGGGRDRIVAGAGDDAISGGVGDDEVRGGGGADRIRGDEGNDSVNGGGGEDFLFGGDGTDEIVGGGGSDTILAPASEVLDRSEEDAKWTDDAGNELDMDQLSDEFWSALDAAERALRDGKVERLENSGADLGAALGEQGSAFLGMLGAIVRDDGVRADTFEDFREVVRDVAPEAEDLVDTLAEDLGDAIEDVADDLPGGDGGDGSGDDGTDGGVARDFLNAPHVPASFVEAIGILESALGELPDDFWEAARRLIENQGRFVDRLESLRAMVGDDVFEGIGQRVGELVDAMIEDGLDPRENRDGFESELASRLASAFADLDRATLDALQGVVLAGARRESAVVELQRIVEGLGEGVPAEFWEKWEAAGQETNDPFGDDGASAFDDAIAILREVVGELPESFFGLLDAFGAALKDEHDAFDAFVQGFSDGQDVGEIEALLDGALDAGYEPGAIVGDLVATLDDALQARYDAMSQEARDAFVGVLDALVRADDAESAVLEQADALSEGELPIEFWDAWERALDHGEGGDDGQGDDHDGDGSGDGTGDDGSDDGSGDDGTEGDALAQALAIIEGVIGGELPDEFWSVLDSMGAAFDAQHMAFESLLEALDGDPDRPIVDAFVGELLALGLAEGGDIEAAIADLPQELQDWYADQSQGVRDALHAGVFAFIAADDAEQDVLDALDALVEGDLPAEFLEAWERAIHPDDGNDGSDDGSGDGDGDGDGDGSDDGVDDARDGMEDLVGLDGVLPAEFFDALTLAETTRGEPFPESFWIDVELLAQSVSTYAQRFGDVLATLDTQDENFNPFPILDASDALASLGYEAGDDVSAYLDSLDPEQRSLIEDASPETGTALLALFDEGARREAMLATISMAIEDLVVGELPPEFFELWEIAGAGVL